MTSVLTKGQKIQGSSLQKGCDLKGAHCWVSLGFGSLSKKTVKGERQTILLKANGKRTKRVKSLILYECFHICVEVLLFHHHQGISICQLHDKIIKWEERKTKCIDVLSPFTLLKKHMAVLIFCLCVYVCVQFLRENIVTLSSYTTDQQGIPHMTDCYSGHGQSRAAEPICSYRSAYVGGHQESCHRALLTLNRLGW